MLVTLLSSIKILKIYFKATLNKLKKKNLHDGFFFNSDFTI